MNLQELRNLQEAYLEVVENQQQLDEGYKNLDLGKKLRMAGKSYRLRGQAERGVKDAARKTGSVDATETQVAIQKGTKKLQRSQKISNTITSHNPEAAKAKEASNRSPIKVQRSGNRISFSAKNSVKKEEVDIYDIILSHLLDEGYAETPEAAEAIMVNMIEGLRVLPREKMQSKAASKRRKALGSALKSKFTTGKGTTERNVVDAKNKKLRSQADKMDKVAGDYTPSGSRNKEAKNRGGSSNPRNRMGPDEYAERQFAKNRAMLGMREQVDIYDIIFSHLLDEGYAETPEAAEAIMVNMSEEWRDSIIG